ncbi:ACN9-domain-containing protein [Parathielavia hyrcaniae]|uniref:Succinate dehydrogenase assembly factor 3 n=1 Tax=Parathielavia hyrcaniae TaxID=113614 RepID=A0AAN6T5Z7_9PEZI|nr:ACN9-domain-containing protein [Parathielavia hyrcaniae]
MRPSLRLLASAVPTTKAISPDPMGLLPPIYLYRRILRAHRKHLTAGERVLGDEYVKSEFRKHRDIENPVHLIGFHTEWKRYAQFVERGTWLEEKLDETKIEKMSDEQLAQLYELMKTIQKLGTEGHGSD